MDAMVDFKVDSMNDPSMMALHDEHLEHFLRNQRIDKFMDENGI